MATRKTSRPSATDVPIRQRGALADLLQRVLGVLPETIEPHDRALRRDVRRYAEELRGLEDKKS